MIDTTSNSSTCIQWSRIYTFIYLQFDQRCFLDFDRCDQVYSDCEGGETIHRSQKWNFPRCRNRHFRSQLSRTLRIDFPFTALLLRLYLQIYIPQIIINKFRFLLRTVQNGKYHSRVDTLCFESNRRSWTKGWSSGWKQGYIHGMHKINIRIASLC